MIYRDTPGSVAEAERVALLRGQLRQGITSDLLAMGRPPVARYPLSVQLGMRRHPLQGVGPEITPRAAPGQNRSGVAGRSCGRVEPLFPLLIVAIFASIVTRHETPPVLKMPSAFARAELR